MADIRKDGHNNVSVFSYAGSITLFIIMNIAAEPKSTNT